MEIDAVITWVDGADEAHKKKRLVASSTPHISIDKEAAIETRFTSVGEIDYCLLSLLKFAPWLRKIYIVTDAQIPPIVTTLSGTSAANRIQVIDHREIFEGYHQYLPTFNSLAIEAMLWRIKGLSEQFIYCNDDCFLLRPVEPEAFFQSGQPVLRGGWKTQKAQQWKTRLGFGSHGVEGHRRFQENSARMLGFKKKFWHLPHVPFPLLKSVFKNYFEQNPEILLHTIRYALRNPEQVWSVSLAYHLGIQKHQIIFDNQLDGVSINPVHHPWHKIRSKWKKAIKNQNTVFACFQSLDCAPLEVRQQLMDWAEQIVLANEEQ